LLSAALLERWPQVCRVKITFKELRTNRFVCTTKKLMKCVVNWIPLRIRVHSRNTQPQLKRQGAPIFFGFWFLVCYAATQLATQFRQRCIQVVRSNKEARKRLTESNSTPEMDLALMNVVLKKNYLYVLFDDCCFEVDIRLRRYTNT